MKKLMRKWVDIDFEIGQEVYLKTDPDQRKRIVTAICLRMGRVTYGITQGTTESWHDDFEMSDSIDVVVKVTDTSN